MSALLAIAFVVFGVLNVVAQTRYLRRLRADGIDPLRSEEIVARPWLFFARFPSIIRGIFTAVGSSQGDADLERSRRTVVRWQRMMLAVFALLLALEIARLLGIG